MAAKCFHVLEKLLSQEESDSFKTCQGQAGAVNEPSQELKEYWNLHCKEVLLELSSGLLSVTIPRL